MRTNDVRTDLCTTIVFALYSYMSFSCAISCVHYIFFFGFCFTIIATIIIIIINIDHLHVCTGFSSAELADTINLIFIHSFVRSFSFISRSLILSPEHFFYIFRPGFFCFFFFSFSFLHWSLKLVSNFEPRPYFVILPQLTYFEHMKIARLTSGTYRAL